MSRTKGKSQSSTSNCARSVPYDLDLPGNKTIAKQKYEISNRGIEFPNYAKKSQLIKISKELCHQNDKASKNLGNIRHDTLPEVNPEVELDMSEQEPSQESRGQPDVSKHGDLQ